MAQGVRGAASSLTSINLSKSLAQEPGLKGEERRGEERASKYNSADFDEGRTGDDCMLYLTERHTCTVHTHTSTCTTEIALVL